MPHDLEQHPISRRTLLGIGWSAFALTMTGMFAATIRFLLPNVLFEPPAAFKIGKPDDYAEGSVTFVSDRKIFVIREDDGAFRAVSATCPHLRCVVRWDANRMAYECPCHGSEFSPRGKVVAGPSPAPLDWWEMTLAPDGRLYVNTLVRVQPDYRLTV